jgi:CRP/FNR family transcriptional regulator, cyclic AMP receptor protein
LYNVGMQEMPSSLKAAQAKARARHIPKGQIILYEGDSPLEVFIIKSGVVKLYNIDDQGNEKVLHLLKPPALMPLAFFSGPESSTRWYYTALVDCDLLVLPRYEMQQLIETDSKSAVYLTNWFSNEVHELLVRLDSLGKTNVRDKLIAALKFLAVCHAVPRRSGWLRVQFPVNHQLLADMVGITRESAAMGMKELADQKIVRNPRLTILEIDFEKLTDLS